jgi:hypothetical protein
MLLLNAFLLADVIEFPETIRPNSIMVKPMKTVIGSTRHSRPRQITQLSLGTAFPFFAQPLLFLLTKQYERFSLAQYRLQVFLRRCSLRTYFSDIVTLFFKVLLDCIIRTSRLEQLRVPAVPAVSTASTNSVKNLSGLNTYLNLHQLP